MTRMQFWPNDLAFGSFVEVIWGHIPVLSINFDRIEMEHWGWSQCVSLAQTHRLICNMTCLARHMTSRDLDLRSNFEIDFLRSICTYFDASWRQEDYADKIMSLALLVQKLLAKKKLLVKKRYFHLSWPLQPNPLTLRQFYFTLAKELWKGYREFFFRACYL